MGFFDWLGGLFGAPKKRDLNLGEPVAMSLTDFPVGKSLQSIILEGLKTTPAGLPTGLIPAIAAQRRAGLAETTIPAIEAAASGRGLGRSTIVPRDIGKATAQTERDIAEEQARFSLQEFLNQQAETARRQNLAMGFLGQQASQQQAGALNEQMRRAQQIGYEQAANLANQQGAARAIGIPLAIGTSLATGNPAFALGAFGAGGGGGVTQLQELLGLAEQARRASPFTRRIQVGGGGGGF